MDIISNKTKATSIEELLNREHEIFQYTCASFIDSSNEELSKNTETAINLQYIITTLIENISRLNSLSKRYEDTIQIYSYYEQILEAIHSRTKVDSYKISYKISFSHAYAMIKIKLASSYNKIGEYEKAYKMTKELIKLFEEFDFTGDYKGYIFNIHAMNCYKTCKKNEAIYSLVEMIKIYIYYNEPYMIKTSINAMKEFIKQYDKKFYSFLVSIEIIDEHFIFHDETTLFVSSSVDIENPLTDGIDQVFSGKITERQLLEYNNMKNNLQPIYKVYGVWRSLHQQTQT